MNHVQLKLLSGSFPMLVAALVWLYLGIGQVQPYIFLKMALAGHPTLFVARTREHFWKKPYPAPVMIWSALLTKLAGPCRPPADSA